MGRATADTIDDAAVVRFAARARPDSERGAAVRDFYGLSATGRVFLRHRFDPVPGRPFHIHGAMRSFPGLGLASLACSASHLERTQHDLHDNDLLLNITLAGERVARHCGREVVFGHGEALLSTGAEASRNTFTDSRFISFRVPFEPIAAMVADVEDHLCRPIRRDIEALRLLAGYGETLMEEGCPSPEMQRVVTTHVYDLVALALGAGRDAAQVAKARGGQAVRLRAVKADIESNLARADLSAATIAARHRIPLRYLQRLFETEGTTCTAYVLKRRLARAHQLLREAGSFDQPISAVAFAAGFGHLSRFNRAFRSRFGQSPTDVRMQAQREDWVMAAASAPSGGRTGCKTSAYRPPNR